MSLRFTLLIGLSIKTILFSGQRVAKIEANWAGEFFFSTSFFPLTDALPAARHASSDEIWVHYSTSCSREKTPLGLMSSFLVGWVGKKKGQSGGRDFFFLISFFYELECTEGGRNTILFFLNEKKTSCRPILAHLGGGQETIFFKGGIIYCEEHASHL